MQFISATSSNGVIERNFAVGEVTGVLWSPASTSAGGPLLLLGHSGGMHKKAPGLVANALHSVTAHGFTVAAIDAPGHGDRPRSDQDQQWAEEIHRARAAGSRSPPSSSTTACRSRGVRYRNGKQRWTRYWRGRRSATKRPSDMAACHRES